MVSYLSALRILINLIKYIIGLHSAYTLLIKVGAYNFALNHELVHVRLHDDMFKNTTVINHRIVYNRISIVSPCKKIIVLVIKAQ